MSIEIFRQNCHFCSATILIHTELSNFLMNYFGNLAVFFSFLNNSPVGAVLASSWFIFVPYNILIVYYKAKYLTVKIDVFILPYKK